MADPKTDRQHLEALLGGLDLWHQFGAELPVDKAYKAAKQHLDTTKPECADREAEIRADERRRIDESIERFQDGEFTVAIAEKGGWCVIDPPLGDCSGLPSLGNGDSPLRAILAATQSIQAEAGDGA